MANTTKLETFNNAVPDQGAFIRIFPIAPARNTCGGPGAAGGDTSETHTPNRASHIGESSSAPTHGRHTHALPLSHYAID